MAFSREKAVELANKLAEKQQFKKAAQQYEQIAQKGMASPTDRLQLGDYYRQAGDGVRALLAWLDVARDFALASQHYKAISVYKYMLRLDPGLYSVHIALARIYQTAGLTNDAVSQYQEAIGVLSVRGKPLDRLEVIRELLALDPENVRARVRLAEDFAGEGAVEDAVKELRIAADVLDRSGHTEDYARVAERLLFHAPEDLTTCRRLAELLLQNGDAQSALPKLQVCFRSEPNDVDVLEMLARAFDMVGQSHKTLTVLKQLARIHDRNGLIVERNAVLSRVVELDPSDESARRAITGRASDPVEELGFSELSFEEGENEIDGEFGGRGRHIPKADANMPSFEDEASLPGGDLPETSNMEDGLSELDAIVAGLSTTAMPPLEPPRRVGTTPAPSPLPPPLPPPTPMAARATAPQPTTRLPDPPPRLAEPPPAVTQDFVEFGFEDLYDDDPKRLKAKEEAKEEAKLIPQRPAGASGLARLPPPSVTVPPAIRFDPIVPTASVEPPLDANLVFDVLEDAPVETSPAPAPLPLDVAGALEEFDFFAGKGLTDEALGVLEEVPAEYREHPAVQARWKRLDTATANG